MGNTTVLMSSPEYFKVEYSINPWMVEGVDVNLDLAKQQWKNLKIISIFYIYLYRSSTAIFVQKLVGVHTKQGKNRIRCTFWFDA